MEHLHSPPAERRCKAISSKTGERCTSWTQPDSDYCYFHSQRNQEQRDIVWEIEKGCFRDLFPEDQSSWSTWKVMLKGIYGLEMTAEEKEVWRHHTGRPATGHHRSYRTIFAVCPRRSGKSFIASLISCYMAVQSWKQHIRKGESAECVLVASDREQAQVCFKYCEEILNSPRVKKKVQIKRQTQSVLELSNGVTIRIATANFRGIRGRTIVCAVLDELAFWRVEGSNPDLEIIRSLRPGMATVPKSMLLGISSPYIKSGVLWENYKDHYGKGQSRTLVIKGASSEFNPSLDLTFIEDELKADSTARSEWFPEFRADLEGFLPGNVI